MKKIPYVEWAFEQGKAAGVEKKTTERGLMLFGLSCAADTQTALNTQNWLNGFACGLKTKPAVNKTEWKV